MRKVLWKLAAISLVIVTLAPPAPAEVCNKPFEQVYSQAIPSVVRIVAIAIDPFSVSQRVRLALGSGVLIDGNGHVVTNAHVVYGTRRIMVGLAPDDTRPARLVGADPVSDIAVVQVNGGTADRPPLRFGDSDHLAIGQDVVAIGHPFGLGASASRGIISGLNRVLPLSPMSWLTPLIQTDAPLNPGNSGGPLVDRCGEVIGIDVLKSRGESVNFAIPSNLARSIAAQLIAHGHVIRPWYGIYGRVLTPDVRFILAMLGGVPMQPGFLVETVEPGSPAEKIGIKGGDVPITLGLNQYLVGGDVITEVDGETLKDMDTVVRIVRSLKVGQTISIVYYHDGTKHTAKVTLPERPVLPGDVEHLRERDDRN